MLPDTCVFVTQPGEVYIYNHFALTVYYHDESSSMFSPGHRIVKVVSCGLFLHLTDPRPPARRLMCSR